MDSLTASSNVDEDWQKYVAEQKEAELNQIIAEERLKEEETKTFVNNSFKNGEIQSAGTSFAKILPPISRFTPIGERTSLKECVLGRLKKDFDRYVIFP